MSNGPASSPISTQTASTMVEEVLRQGLFEMGRRMGGGGGLVPFVATEDVLVDGQRIAAGDAVCVDPSGAGHDPAVYPDGDRFDISRKDNPHLTLSFGIHHCLGAPLARMEMQVGISELFRRPPGLHLAGEVTISRASIVRPLTEVPVTW